MGETTVPTNSRLLARYLFGAAATEKLPKDSICLVHIGLCEATARETPWPSRSTEAWPASKTTLARPTPGSSQGLVGAGDLLELLLCRFAIIGVAVLARNYN